MKRLIGLLLLLSIFTAPAWSQEDPSRRFKAGVLVGFNASQIDGDGYTGFDKAGALIGGYVYSDIAEKFRVQFELNYTQKGSRDPVGSDSINLNFYRIALDYMEIPLLFQYRNKKFLYEVGPSLGVLVRSVEEDANGILEGQQENFDFHATEIAYHLGVSYQLMDQLSAGARYSRSLLPVSDKTEFLTRFATFGGGSYNIVIGLSLRYTFSK